LNYLVDLQKRQYGLDPKLDLLDALIPDFCHWYEGYLGPQPLLEPAMREMFTGSPLPGDALLDIGFYLRGAGKLTVSMEDLSNFMKNDQVDDRRVQFAGVVYSEDHDAVYLSRGKLATALLKERLPTLDFGLATRDFALRKLCVSGLSTPYGWLIRRDYWDARSTKWQES
jgi:hypothetical protein